MYGYIEAMMALWHDRMQATTWYWSFCMKENQRELTHAGIQSDFSAMW